MVMITKKEARPFFDFMNERQWIWRRRFGLKQKPPWTKDEILQTYFFTNVYRELDRVTIALQKRMYRLRNEAKYNRLFHIILFRAFNLPSTYDHLVDWGAISPKNAGKFDPDLAKRILHGRKKDGAKIFTGAYVISNGASTRPKIDVVVDSLRPLWGTRRLIWKEMQDADSMQAATEILADHPMMGMFNSYEVACDLRHQKGMLDTATDILTWANIGPGARRGVNYMLSGKQKPHVLDGDDEYNRVMQELLAMSPTMLDDDAFQHMPRLEMREIEHTLCEFAKYMNAMTGQRRLKRKYHHAT